jgi:hypothetical protein
VICLGRGGALDSVIENETGIFFKDQTVPSIVDAVDRFENLAEPLDPFRIRSHSERFSSECFRFALLQLVEKLWNQNQQVLHRIRPGWTASSELVARASL